MWIEFGQKQQPIMLYLLPVRMPVLWLVLFFPLLLRGQCGQESSLYQRVHQIYENLVAAIGHDQLRHAPVLCMPDRMQIPATFDAHSNTISIELPLCEQLLRRMPEHFDEGVALILGHELGHFFAQDECVEGFGVIRAASGPQDTLQLQRELKADYFGGFAAYLAMYVNALDHFEPILQLVYDMYHIQWPRFEERIQMAEGVYEDIDTLIGVFETGNLLTFIDQPLEANACFTYILHKFQSREIQNNLAVNYLRHAFLYMDYRRRKYVFPFELDPRTRLFTNIRKPYFPNADSANKYLQIALRLLREAVAQDTSYYQGVVNLACVYALMDDMKQLDRLLRQLRAKAYPLLVRQYGTLVEGLAFALKGEKKMALRVLHAVEEAAQDSMLQAIAELNAQVVAGKPIHDNISEEKSIYCLPAFQYLSNPQAIAYTNTLPITARDHIYVAHLPYKAKIISYKQQFLFYLPSTYEQEVCGELAVGATIEQVLQVMGRPTRIIFSNLEGYNFYHYHRSNVVLSVKNNVLDRWWAYYIP